LLAALFAGLVAVLGKVGVKNVDTTLATAVRAVVKTKPPGAAGALLGFLPLADSDAAAVSPPWPACPGSSIPLCERDP